MSNLIPTPRADKNGKIVIRHVRADTGEATTISIPAPPVPTLNKDAGIEAVRVSLTDAIYTATVDYTEYQGTDDVDWEGTETRDNIYKKLLVLPSILLVDLDDMQQSDPSKFHLIARLIEQGEKEIFLSNYIAFSDLADPEWDGMDVSLSRSVTYYPQLKQYNYDPRGAGPEVVESVRAVLEVAQHLQLLVDEGTLKTDAVEAVHHDYDFERTPVIRDASLVDYLMENPEKVDDIKAVITERKVTDPEIIKSVLEHPERALSSGTL